MTTQAQAAVRRYKVMMWGKGTLPLRGPRIDGRSCPAAVVQVTLGRHLGRGRGYTDIREVWFTADTAERRMREAAPNGRDYYVRGAGAPIAADTAYRAQVRAAIEATEPEALAQFDAGRITAGRIRATVGYAALSECSAYPGGVAHREAPYIPQPRTGPVSAAAWRAWLMARDEAATTTRETP